MKKMMLGILFSIFLLSAFAVPSMSQVTIGVTEGDWFLYEGTLVFYNATEEIPWPPNEYTTVVQTYNESDWEKYTVTDITGNNVTFDVVTHWKNGTETTGVLNEDITVGFAFQAISTDLGPGDLLRDEYDWGFMLWPPRYLNESMMWTYGDETRETNVLNWFHPVFWEGSFTNQQYYWDAQTGILVKYYVAGNQSDFMTGGEYQYICENVLVDTNLWVIPEFPTSTIMLFVFVTFTVSIDIYRRKKLKH